jgi:dephospho-CoA kinase
MIKVGITGEMGSGKSHCAKLFERLGVPIFYSDDVARTIINTNIDLRNKICKEFGNVYDEDGVMIPSLIRSIVFSEGNESKLKKLNELTHSYVFEEFENFCNLNKSKKYILAESAILYETGFNKYFDKIIYVYAPEETRIQRTFDRSGFSEEEYKQRMKNQLPYNSKRNWANYIIENYDDKDIESQVRGIDGKLVSL